MATAASMTVRSFAAKKNAAINSIAVSISRSRNDVLYMKLRKYRALWKETKDQIVQKYSSQALSKWAQNQAKG